MQGSFLTVSAQTDSNCFFLLLILQIAKPPTKKREIVVFIINIFGLNVSFLSYDNIYHAEGHTEVEITEKPSWENIYSQILMRETFLDFFKIEEFYQCRNFGYW